MDTGGTLRSAFSENFVEVAHQKGDHLYRYVCEDGDRLFYSRSLASLFSFSDRFDNPCSRGLEFRPGAVNKLLELAKRGGDTRLQATIERILSKRLTRVPKFLESRIADFEENSPVFRSQICHGLQLLLEMSLYLLGWEGPHVPYPVSVSTPNDIFVERKLYLCRMVLSSNKSSWNYIAALPLLYLTGSSFEQRPETTIFSLLDSLDRKGIPENIVPGSILLTTTVGYLCFLCSASPDTQLLDLVIGHFPDQTL